jgi:hypothetical protein
MNIVIEEKPIVQDLRKAEESARDQAIYRLILPG